MQSVNLVVLIVAIIVSLFQQGVSSYEIVGDLSALQEQFQTLLTELETTPTTHDTSIATLLQKLDLLQYSSPSSSPNITLEWYTPPKDFPIHPPLRIVIVVSSFEGMFLNSGIGTFYSSLADFLVQHGHTVTILYTDTSASDTPTFTKWKSQAEKRGLRVARLGAYPIHLRLSPLAQRSYQVYEYLKNRQSEFDVVHFPDWEGPGYYTMLAKKDGIAFLSKLFIVGIHGPWRWVKAANHPNTVSAKLESATDMETDWMERKSVEMSDMVWTPSSDIVQWLARQGWALPADSFKMPYLPGREISQVKMSATDEDGLQDNINEIVFFGRLETRKGLELFADALDRLAVTRPEFAGTKVTFLGRSATIGNMTANAYLDERYVKGAWPYKLVYISHKDRKAALEYLREPTRIAVMPSLVDNTPYTVYECLLSEIPFIASNIPSIASIIDSEDRTKVLFDVDPVSLARKLEDVFDNGARAVRSSLQLNQIESSWLGFYSKAYAMISEQKAAVMKLTEKQLKATPLISVCITHYNRPHFLQLALESVEAQSYTNYEIILVDDGSTSQEAKDYLKTLAPKFTSKGWQLILSTNQYLGAARNKAAQHARGEYLFFLDDDNLASAHLLSTYAGVAAHTHAEILTAAHNVFEGNGKADEGTVIGRWVPLGASPSVGLFKNCFGDANFFVKKSTFTSLNGFTEDRGVGQEDHEFLAKAVLDGRSLTVIPEPLLSYRMHNQSEQMLYTTDSLRNALRAHRPYRNLMEESGMEVSERLGTVSPRSVSPTASSRSTSSDSLKLLAYSRAHSRQVSAVCNLTVTSVIPNQFLARKVTPLTFITAVRDCDIEAIRIGDVYTCTLYGNATQTAFMCNSQAIPVPGNYPVYLKYSTESEFRDTSTRVTVKASQSTDGSTTAVATLAVFREAGLFNSTELLGLLAKIYPLPPSAFEMLSDMVTPVGSAKRDVNALDELHTTLISITSLNPTAANAFNFIFNVLAATPKVILPYRFHSLLLNAICDPQGQCSCAPNFVGVGCTQPARCPNDCSNNGNCTSTQTGKVCKCLADWTGTDCSTGLCPKNCNGHGTCNLELMAGNGSCVCDPGWLGAACDKPNCPGNCNGFPCRPDGSCSCPAGRNTDDCSLLGSGQTSGSQINVDGAKDSDDNFERNVFIGTAVTFGVVATAAGGFLYHAHRAKQARELAAEGY